MSPWSLLWKAAAPVLPWLIAGLVALIAITTATAYFIGARAGHDRAQVACEEARAESERRARLWYEAEIGKRDAQAERERERAARFKRLLADARAAAESERKDLQNALNQTDLRRCDARGPARVLRNKAARIRRDITGSAPGAGRIHGAAVRTAGDAGSGSRDGRDRDAVGG